MCGSGRVAILTASSQDCSLCPASFSPMCLQTCAVASDSKDWMSWKVLSEGIIFSVYRITLTETGLREIPQSTTWNPSTVTHPWVNIWIHGLWQIPSHSAEEDGVFSRNTAIKRHSFGFLVMWGHWQSPPEEQRLSCSYPCLKIERDKDRAWIPTAFLSRHWVASELCSLLQGKGLRGRKQAGAAENRASKVSCLRDEDVAAGEIFSE